MRQARATTARHIDNLVDAGADLRRAALAAADHVSRNGGSVVVALVGIDKLTDGADLRWWPDDLPLRIRILASAVAESEAFFAARKRGWTSIVLMQPFTPTQQREFVDRTLAQWGRQIRGEDINALLAHHFAKFPLFLKTVLEELRVTATHEELGRRIRSYYGMRELGQVFARQIQRIADDDNPLAWPMAYLIGACAAGLEESEIISLAGATPYAWAKLRHALGDSIREQRGRYLASDHLHECLLFDKETRKWAHQRLAEWFRQRPHDDRRAREILRHLVNAEDWEALEVELTDLDRISGWLRYYSLGFLRNCLQRWRAKRDPAPLLRLAFERRAGSAYETWNEGHIELAASVAHLLDCLDDGATVRWLHEGRVAASTRLFGPDDVRTKRCVEELAAHWTSRHS